MFKYVPVFVFLYVCLATKKNNKTKSKALSFPLPLPNVYSWPLRHSAATCHEELKSYLIASIIHHNCENKLFEKHALYGRLASWLAGWPLPGKMKQRWKHRTHIHILGGKNHRVLPAVWVSVWDTLGREKKNEQNKTSEHLPWESKQVPTWLLNWK